MTKIAIAFCCLLFVVNCKAQNDISFEKEDITFEIKDSLFSVQGIYYFNSTSTNKTAFLYPFPTDSIYSKPFKIRLAYVNSGKTIEYKMVNDSSSIMFRVYTDLNQPILISYTQGLKSNKARYILLTTNYWRKSIKQVDYKLVTDSNLSIKEFSIQPDKTIQIDNNKVYFWHKEDFTPIKDFIIVY